MHIMPTSISRVFCFGLGYLARHVASALKAHAAEGQEIIVHGTCRNPSNAHEFLFDDTHELSDAAYETLQQADAVLVSIPPDEQGDIVLRQYQDFLSYMPNLKWVGYCSSAAVYGDHRGNWVDETSMVNPLSLRAVYRVKAEQQWLQSKLPVHIFRLGAIYGQGRSALDQARSGMPLLRKQDHVMNRIHVEDASRAICTSMHNPNAGSVYNLSDDCPASREEVLRYAYELLSLPVPEPVLWDEADLSAMTRSFFEECKRVRSDLTKKQLGIEWRYSDYRSGLDSLLRNSSNDNGDAVIALRQIVE